MLVAFVLRKPKSGNGVLDARLLVNGRALKRMAGEVDLLI